MTEHSPCSHQATRSPILWCTAETEQQQPEPSVQFGRDAQQRTRASVVYLEFTLAPSLHVSLSRQVPAHTSHAPTMPEAGVSEFLLTGHTRRGRHEMSDDGGRGADSPM